MSFSYRRNYVGPLQKELPATRSIHSRMERVAGSGLAHTLQQCGGIAIPIRLLSVPACHPPTGTSA